MTPLQNSQELSKAETAQPIELIINKTVEKLKAIFPGWKASFGGKSDTQGKEFAAYRKEFFLAMYAAGINTQEKIDFGINKARREASDGREFMPSGAMFSGWCEPSAEDMGLPSLEAAYQDLIHGRWGNMPIAFRVVFSSQRYNLRDMNEVQARKKFTILYRETVQRIANGEKFEIPERPAIASPSGTTHTKINGPTGNEAMRNLLGMMGSRKARG